MCKVFLFFFQTVHFGRDVVHFFLTLVKWQSLLQDYDYARSQTFYMNCKGIPSNHPHVYLLLGCMLLNMIPIWKRNIIFPRHLHLASTFGVSIILLFWGYSGCVFLLAIIGKWSNVVSSDSLHFPRRSGIVEPVCLSCRRKLQGYIIPWELIWGKWGELPPLPPLVFRGCSKSCIEFRESLNRGMECLLLRCVAGLSLGFVDIFLLRFCGTPKQYVSSQGMAVFDPLISLWTSGNFN